MRDLEYYSGKKIALSGVVIALSVIFIYLAAITPINKLFFYAIGSMFIFAVVIESGPSAACITYAAITMLGFILIPNKILMMPYLLFFGYYGVLKYFIEKLNYLFWEWVLKVLSFNIAMYATYIIVTQLVLDTISTRYAVWITILLGEVAFIIYDIGYSLVISYYMHRIRNKL